MRQTTLPPVRRPSWQHRAEYLLTRTLQGLVTTLPERAAERLGAGVGALVHSPLAIRRRTAEENLRRAFPDAAEGWIQQTARAAFRHLGREAAAILRLSRLDATEVVARTEVEGWEALEEALAEGRGAIVVTGHFGNWEIGAAAYAARGITFEAVVRPQSNRLVDARLQETRRRLGVRTIEQGVAPQRIPRALRAGRVVGMVADQDARAAGVWAPFFGHPASTHRGPALFALRLGAPLFASFARRLPGARARYHVTIERLPLRRTDNMEADIRRITGELNARVEAAIRAAPGQYFWFHRRWKSIPPAELTGEGLGTSFQHESAEA